MTIIRIINLLVSNEEFIQALQHYDINVNCTAVSCRTATLPDGRIAAEVIFDFLPAGNSSNDMRAKVFYTPATNALTIHSFDLPWPV